MLSTVLSNTHVKSLTFQQPREGSVIITHPPGDKLKAQRGLESSTSTTVESGRARARSRSFAHNSIFLTIISPGQCLAQSWHPTNARRMNKAGTEVARSFHTPGPPSAHGPESLGLDTVLCSAHLHRNSGKGQCLELGALLGCPQEAFPPASRR